MSKAKVRFMPADREIEVLPGEIILDAALRQQMAVGYSCRSGTCRTCLFRVVQGQVEQMDADDCLISPQELENGRRLICMSVARSDAVLEKVAPGKTVP